MGSAQNVLYFHSKLSLSLFHTQLIHFFQSAASDITAFYRPFYFILFFGTWYYPFLAWRAQSLFSFSYTGASLNFIYMQH